MFNAKKKRKKERNLLSAINVASDMDNGQLNRSRIFKKIWNHIPE